MPKGGGYARCGARSLTAAAGEAASDPAFTRSQFIAPPARIVAGEPFELRYLVRNDGPTTQYMRVTFELPTGLLMAGPAGDCFTRFDPEETKRVVALRGFGGACLFALIPLAVLALLAWMMPRRRLPA